MTYSIKPDNSLETINLAPWILVHKGVSSEASREFLRGCVLKDPCKALLVNTNMY